MRKFIPAILAILFVIGITAADASISHAQTYGGNGTFTFYSNSSGQYWCFANGDVTFQSTTGAISWTTVGSPGYIPCPAPVTTAVVTTQPVYSQPVQTVVAQPAVQPVVVQPVVVNTGCNNAYPYSGYPYSYPYAYNSYAYNNFYNNGCGGPVVQPYPYPYANCLAIGCNCNFPGSCGQGRPPRQNPNNPPICGRGQHLVPVSPATTPPSYTCQ